jgi:Zn-dependent peptidase ImmA (M78 family)/transcriptional regulator with XRE-family HTH domain
MKSEPVLYIQPAVIRWARESIGLSVYDVAAKLKRPIHEIEEWEVGANTPSYAQLEKLAYQIYKRPLAVFFLPAPPEEIPPEREFRTLPHADLLNLSADTHIQIRRAHAYQIALKELFEGSNPAKKCIWKDVHISPESSSSIVKLAQLIRNYLDVSLEGQVTWKHDDYALKQWRQAIENVGIFIFKAPFKQKEISGFSLLEQEFPLIYLNNGTTKTRQIFSLLHELSHVLINVNGLTKLDKSYIQQLPKTEKKIEQLCNAIAAEVLIPLSDFEKQTKSLTEGIDRISEVQYADLANRYGVSREAILRRFLDQGHVSVSYYEEQAKKWAQQQKAGGKGNWYASQNTYLSDRFAKEVVSRHYRNELTVEQASDFLGIKAKNFAGLEQRILQGGAS